MDMLELGRIAAWLANDIEVCRVRGENPSEKSWNGNVGVIISAYDAEVILESIRAHRTRPAATIEPMPKPGIDDVLPELINDLKARAAVGLVEYGFPLQTHNGRDPLNDALQEALDLAMYLKQEIMQREKPLEDQK